MKKFILIFLSLVLLFSCTKDDGSNNDDSGSIPTGIIGESDLEYLGAFRLPDGISDTKSWEWGGTSMTYFPGGDPDGPNDGYQGSIFGGGHEWEHQIAEVDIPVPVISQSKNLSDLNRATFIQSFRDILNVGNLEMPRTGIQYLSAQTGQSEGKIYFCIGEHMQEHEKRASHGMFDVNLSNPNKRGLWRVDDFLNYVTTDYMFEIPKNWADEYIGGKCLATGRFRDGGQGGMGPSLIAIAPWENGNTPENNATIDARSLLLYQNVYVDNPKTMKDYHHSDEWSGGLWLTKGEKAAVVFIGTKGIGDCWYGFSNGVRWEEPYPNVPDYPHDDRGWWSTGFRAYFIFYDPADLIAVSKGEKASYEPQPYLTIDIGKYLFNGDYKTYETDHGDEQVQRKYRLGGCSFDRERGIMYVFELFADEDRPLIHAWKIK